MVIVDASVSGSRTKRKSPQSSQRAGGMSHAGKRSRCLLNAWTPTAQVREKALDHEEVGVTDLRLVDQSGELHGGSPAGTVRVVEHRARRAVIEDAVIRIVS